MPIPVAEERLKAPAVIELAIWGVDASGKPFTQTVEASDLTPSGAQLNDVCCALNIGDIIGVGRQGRKARFRVTWADVADAERARQVGVECVTGDHQLWSTDETETLPRAERPRRASPQPGRQWLPASGRRHPRFRCSGGIRLGAVDEVAGWATMKNLSLGGCYVEIANTPQPGKQLKLQLGMKNLELQTLAVVRWSNPGIGIGLEFLALPAETKVALARWAAAQTTR